MSRGERDARRKLLMLQGALCRLEIIQARVALKDAAEPKAVHVPRIRPPVVALDEGPLVLVETRKDLSDMKLPF